MVPGIIGLVVDSDIQELVEKGENVVDYIKNTNAG